MHYIQGSDICGVGLGPQGRLEPVLSTVFIKGPNAYKETTDCHEISFERRNRSRENVSTVKMKGVNLYQAVCLGIAMPWAQVNVGR